MTIKEEDNEVVLNIESKAVQLHLEFLQDIISRLSSKSSTCKNWCITLTSAFILLSLRLENGSKYILLSYIPIIIFALLNIYYVFLEKSFRENYNDFIKKLHNNELEISDIYEISSQTEKQCDCEKWKSVIKSPSIFIFYAPLFVIDLVVTVFLFCGQ